MGTASSTSSGKAATGDVRPSSTTSGSTCIRSSTPRAGRSSAGSGAGIGEPAPGGGPGGDRQRSFTPTTRSGELRPGSRFSDDRLEVESPGLLPSASPWKICLLGFQASEPRAREGLSRLGLVEQWGSGAQRMIAACRDNGLPLCGGSGAE